MVLKVKVRRFISEYLSSIVFFVLKIKFKFYIFKNKPPIIILTPGKVGSSSVYYTLKKALKTNHVFHIHNLSKLGIDDSVKSHLSSDRKSLPMHLLVSKLLFKKLEYYKGPLKIITLTREPFSRSISDFFQNIDFYKEDLENANLVINEKKALIYINKGFEESLSYLENWFDYELKNNLKIDVFQEKYPIYKRYQIFKRGKVEVLLIRMEDLNANFTKATKEFFNIKKGIALEKYNVGDKKYYSEQYKTIRDKISIDRQKLELIINSKYFSHFYKGHSQKIIDKYTNLNK